MPKIDLQKLSTIQLLGYADMAHSSMNELMNTGADFMSNQYAGGISAEDNIKNLDILQKHLNSYAEQHNIIVKEFF